MERQFVIETDSLSKLVFVYEVTRKYADQVEYRREAGVKSLVAGPLDPRFYGQLDALLLTADKIQQAKPIVPELAEKWESL